MFDRVKYSLLWKLITDPKPENYVDDRIYIDRDYIIFQQVLNFLRNGFKKVKFGDEVKQ